MHQAETERHLDWCETTLPPLGAIKAGTEVRDLAEVPVEISHLDQAAPRIEGRIHQVQRSSISQYRTAQNTDEAGALVEMLENFAVEAIEDRNALLGDGRSRSVSLHRVLPRTCRVDRVPQAQHEQGPRLLRGHRLQERQVHYVRGVGRTAWVVDLGGTIHTGVAGHRVLPPAFRSRATGGVRRLLVGPDTLPEMHWFGGIAWLDTGHSGLSLRHA